MRLVVEKYKFILHTRQIRISSDYEETEFKSARVFVKGVTPDNKLVLRSSARITGNETQAVVQYRFGQEEPTVARGFDEESGAQRILPVSDSFTAYVPIEKLHFGEWADYRIDGEVSDISPKYNGIEVGGIRRRQNSNTIYAANAVERSGVLW
jgi:hypothetical protein